MNETKIVKNGTFARCLKYVVAKECEMKGEENNERIFNHHTFIFFLSPQPMLDYVKTKSRQGIFFSKPEEKIHLPDGAELVMRCPDQRFLLKFIFQAGSFKTHSLETTQALLLSTWILFSSARSVNKSEK